MAKSIKVSDHKTYDPNISLTGQDSYHLVQEIGTNVELLFNNFPDQEMRYLIVVNCKTGESVKLTFE